MHPHTARASGIVVALSSLLLLGLAGCSDAPRARVLLVGIDGATLRIAAPLLEAGRLPNLARIARAGVAGPLRSQAPLLSPRVWNTIATGKTPRKHGIVGFTRKDAEGERRLLLSSDRKAAALWNIASEAGRTVGVVNWWNTYPPERIRGVMASDHLLDRKQGLAAHVEARAPEGGALAFPAEWQPKLAAALERDDPPVAFADPFRDSRHLTEEAVAWLSERFARDAQYLRMALAIEDALHPDLLMLLLPGIDRVSHVLWTEAEGDDARPDGTQRSAAEHHEAAGMIRRYYEYTDGLIGALAGRYAPRDLVVVVSDHGFEANPGDGLPGRHTTEAALDGVLFARGPGLPAGASSDGVGIADVAPLVLAGLGLPVAEDMDGGVPAFWSGAPATTVATYDTGSIERVGGEPSGADDAILEQLRELGYIE